MNQKEKSTWAVDYGKVDLKSLIVTNDPKLYEKQKAKGEVAVLFEPSVLEQMKAEQGVIYLVGLDEVNHKEVKKMDIETQKVVNETIKEICGLIQREINSDSAVNREQLPSLIEALAKIIHY